MDGSEEKKIIKKYITDCIKIMKSAHIVLPKQASVNIYHHRGADKLSETGAMFINVVNRDYCKSIVVILPGQAYPDHYHRIKTESFYVLCGELIAAVDGEVHRVQPGELLHIERGQDHSFSAETGTVFEEISTMYVPNDSVYTDDKISSTSYAQRRTTLTAEEWKEITENA
ncbi:MAG: cupin domain-containing protein [Ruminiclostridium sp.]|nr:cupin domain-containing protein [Ruminiclostridium sp.]